MPVIIAPASSLTSGIPEGPRLDIELGLLNNLSDAGLKSGEQQFIDLLDRAAGQQCVRLRLFSLPQIERGAGAKARLAGVYGTIDALKDADLDGLIVTGCEPRAADLREEAFWGALVEVVDWARDNTRSTIWSCLAAHAAVLHLDGIERRRLPGKCSGVFPVERTSAHPLLSGLADRSQVPHSRYNGLDENDLRDRGYGIVTMSPDAGVDAFVKSDASLFVFLQGHPEYDRDALCREYRRDVRRYADGVASTHPGIPENYFASETEVALQSAAVKAAEDRAGAVNLPEHLALRDWQDGFATTFFRNWLHYLAAEAAACAA